MSDDRIRDLAGVYELLERIEHTVRLIPSTTSLEEIAQQLEPILAAQVERCREIEQAQARIEQEFSRQETVVRQSANELADQFSRYQERMQKDMTEIRHAATQCESATVQSSNLAEDLSQRLLKTTSNVEGYLRHVAESAAGLIRRQEQEFSRTCQTLTVAINRLKSANHHMVWWIAGAALTGAILGAVSIPTDPRPTATDGANQPSQRLSALERLQRIVGIETAREKAERERLAKLFQIDRNDPNQRAGIARGEQMVRAVQYNVLIKDDPEKAREQAPILREQSLQAKGVIAEYRDQTGREPAPILTPDQRDYLTAHRDASDSQAQRKALREGLERAIIVGESSRGVSLDYERPESHRQETKSEPQRDHGGDSFRGR